MLAKLTAIAPIFLCQKSKNLKCKYKKAAHKTFLPKSHSKKVGEIDQKREKGEREA